MKKTALLATKALLAAVLLGWLVWKNRLDLGALSGVFSTAGNVGLALLAAGATFAGMFLLALRLMVLMRSRGVRVGFARALGVTLLSSFVGIVLPGLVGGDVVKAAYLCGDTPGRRSEAVGAVLVDRIIGLYALFLVAAAASFAVMAGGGPRLPAALAWTSPAVVAGLSLCLAAVAFGGGRIGDRLAGGGLVRKVLNVGRVLRGYARRPAILAACVLLAAVNHLMVIFSFVVAGRLLGDDLRLVDQLALAPMAMAMNMAPLTPGGVGLAEGAFSFLYQAAGSAAGANIGLLGRLLQYAAIAAGGLAAALGLRFRPRTDVRRAD